jgi:hypothetical protein
LLDIDSIDAPADHRGQSQPREYSSKYDRQSGAQPLND